MKEDRMPEIPAEQWSEAQKQAAEQFATQRKTGVFGPFVPLLRSPEVMLRAAALGDYLRFRNVLPLKVSEMVILLTARHWTQQYEWNYHYPLAIKAGLATEKAEALAEGRRPAAMDNEEETAYEFCCELHANHGVSDTTYARALQLFGEQGAIDLVALTGYYSLLAMVMNTARTALPKDAKPALPLLPQ